MATVPEWARPYFGDLGNDVSLTWDDGYRRWKANGYGSDDAYYRALIPWHTEDGPLYGPRYGSEGEILFTGGEGETMGEMVPYWDSPGLLKEIAKQYGGGAATLGGLDALYADYLRTELPGGGVSFDQYINTIYPGARNVDIPGIGKAMVADREVPFDWSGYTSYDENHGLEMILKDILPAALTMYGIGTGIGNLASMAGIGGTSGMAGMAEGYGALEASMGTPSSYVGSAAGATTTPLATLPSIAETALPAAAGGTTTLPATGDFSLVPQGSNAGIGGVGTAGTGLQIPGTAATGVGAGSGSLGLNLGAGGIIADTAAQLGAEGIGTGAGLLNPGATTTPTGGSPTGATTPTSPVTDAADNVYNPGNPSNPIPNTTTPTPKSFWQTLEEALGLPVNALQGATQAATSNPFLKGLGLLGDALLSNYNTNKLGDAITQAQGMADPFGPQRGFYQNMLKESYTNPNFFKDNATLGGIRNMAVNDVSRAMAAQGYNQSTNALYGIGQRLQDEGTKYALGFQNQLGQLAGAGISPQEAARLGMQGTQLANQGRQQTATSIGDLARELPNIMKGFGLT